MSTYRKYGISGFINRFIISFFLMVMLCKQVTSQTSKRDTCVEGTYYDNDKANCTRCGFCLGQSLCKRQTGKCDSGCAAGYRPPLCKLECAEGTFGGDCGGNCIKGCKNGQCNRTTGVCNDGCKSGYLGKLCNVECPVGSYGDSCINRCSDGCSNTCDFQTGQCDCKIGYNGTLCLECPVGTYGEDCLGSCENCSSGLCDRLNGSCQYIQISENEINTDIHCRAWFVYGIPIGSVGIVVVVVIMALVCVLRTKRKARKHSLVEQKLDSVHFKLNEIHGRSKECFINSAADDTTDNVPDPFPPQSRESDIVVSFSSHLNEKNKAFTSFDEDGYIRSVHNVDAKNKEIRTSQEDGYIKSERYVGFKWSGGVVSAKPPEVNANDDGENYMNVNIQPLPGQGEELYVNTDELEENPSSPIYENYRTDDFRKTSRF